jgi:putative ATPase
LSCHSALIAFAGESIRMSPMELFPTPQSSRKKELPLAERMRPRSIEEVVGQAHLIGEGRPLSVFSANPPSLIFWGPPGVGKTTLAKLLAGDRPFHQISAVLDGVAELRRVIEILRHESRRAVLFVDEIHRWNKAQQDSLLPYLENGTFTLIGATTENPSFSLIAPLLSRCKVLTLKSLGKAEIREILHRALADRERGLGARFVRVEEDAMDFLAEDASGDARKALHTLEIAAELNHHVTLETLKSVLQKRTLRYDKSGEQHYDIISAFIKSMRGSDPDAAVYYLARMYEAGEDPRFLARRMVIFSAEDIGMADPRALQVAIAAAEAFDRVGRPKAGYRSRRPPFTSPSLPRAMLLIWPIKRQKRPWKNLAIFPFLCTCATLPPS